MSSIDVRTGSLIGALADVIIKVLTVVIVGVGDEMSADTEITVVDAAFAVAAPYTGDVLIAVLINALAGSPFDAPNNGVDVVKVI